jgi:hypothetical protein
VNNELASWKKILLGCFFCFQGLEALPAKKNSGCKGYCTFYELQGREVENNVSQSQLVLHFFKRIRKSKTFCKAAEQSLKAQW